MWEKIQKQALKTVNKLCKDHGYAYVAYKLGYRSSSTVEAWIKRKKIPAWCVDRVEGLRIEEERKAI